MLSSLHWTKWVAATRPKQRRFLIMRKTVDVFGAQGATSPVKKRDSTPWRNFLSSGHVQELWWLAAMVVHNIEKAGKVSPPPEFRCLAGGTKTARRAKA